MEIKCWFLLSSSSFYQLYKLLASHFFNLYRGRSVPNRNTSHTLTKRRVRCFIKTRCLDTTWSIREQHVCGMLELFNLPITATTYCDLTPHPRGNHRWGAFTAMIRSGPRTQPQRASCHGAPGGAVVVFTALKRLPVGQPSPAPRPAKTTRQCYGRSKKTPFHAHTHKTKDLQPCLCSRILSGTR